MSLETESREPSRYPNGEGCQAPLSNSQAAAPDLGGVSEGDRTGRADRLSREHSRRASATQPAGQGGTPTEPVRAAGVVGVPHSSVDPPESTTGGERRRGTWVNAHGHGGLEACPANQRRSDFGVRVCAGEAGCHAGESPAGRIGLFTTESRVREEAVRPNLKARPGLNCPVATTVNLIE